jgi:predicted RNase H-like nuclease (RuvC/YqgF family)
LKKKFHREIKHETSILISPEEKIKKEAIQISILENALKKEHNESAELSKENEILQVLIKEQQNELEILRLNCQNLKRNKALQLGKSQESLSEKNDKSIIAELTLKIAFKDKEIEQLMKFNHEQRKQIENLELKVGSASTEAKRNFVSIFGN